jgi:hypothetical protein
MTETRSYELTPEQVLEICQALKFHADALKQASSLWQRERLDHFIKDVFKLGALIWREFVQARFINLQFPVFCELGLCFEFSLNGPGIHLCLHILNEIIKL